MMPDGTTGRRAQHGVMPGHVSRYGTHSRTFEATFRCGSLCPDQERNPEQCCGHRLRFHW